MTEANLTVFIVDDDHGIRTSLSRALTKRGFTVETFESATSFLDSYSGNRDGCLILDYGMPSMNGLELQQSLLIQGHMIPIIFVTGHGGVPESVQAIKAGAVDFLEKPFRQTVLIERILAAFEMSKRTRQTEMENREVRAGFDKLTTREGEIVQLMVSDPSNTSSKDIARLLDISPRTVDHHRARILEKMDVGSVVELVNLLKDSGLFAE
ncbi:UNVERIFIED_CONTAM: hypothetical protein GTU68_051386 [Idotea baltica]|nr:hypothetical protein [Idotea baltica]